jgi:hypothetical protein
MAISDVLFGPPISIVGLYTKETLTLDEYQTNKLPRPPHEQCNAKKSPC